MLGDILQMAVSAVLGGGLATAFASWYNARKQAQVGLSGVEVEASQARTADWSGFTTALRGEMDVLRGEVNSLRGEVNKLRRERADDAEYIDQLEEHIWLGRGKPPPKRRARAYDLTDQKEG